MSATRILKLATTNRHWDEMRDIVDYYLLDSLSPGDNSWQKGYDVINSWHDCGYFADVDIVELYVTSKPMINAGIIAAFDDLGISIRIKEHVSHGRYRVIERNRYAQH